MKTRAMNFAGEVEVLHGQLPAADSVRALHPAIAEVVGHRLMHALRIGSAPEVEIIDSARAQDLAAQHWIVKAIAGNRLRVCFPPREAEKVSRWAVAIAKIPRAIPLSFLRKEYGISTAKSDVRLDDVRRSGMELLEYLCCFRRDLPPNKPVPHPLGWQIISHVLWTGKDEVPNASEFYQDFVPPADWSAVRNAIAWDSPGMLAIHAARLFLGCSTAHASNILVDAEGHLYSIDHEFVSRTDGGELLLLFDSLRPGTRAFDSTRGVARLSEEEMRDLFEDLPGVPGGTPGWFRWPLGNKDKTVTHFVDRLRMWKVLLEMREKGANV